MNQYLTLLSSYPCYLLLKWTSPLTSPSLKPFRRQILRVPSALRTYELRTHFIPLPICILYTSYILFLSILGVNTRVQRRDFTESRSTLSMLLLSAVVSVISVASIKIVTFTLIE